MVRDRSSSVLGRGFQRALASISIGELERSIPTDPGDSENSILFQRLSGAPTVSRTQMPSIMTVMTFLRSCDSGLPGIAIACTQTKEHPSRTGRWGVGVEN